MRSLLVALLLVACSSKPGGGVDGGGGNDGPAGGGDAFDAPIDVPFVRGPVAVHVKNATSMAARCNPVLDVVYIDVDQTVIEKTTSTAGDATADVFPGASVTVICARTTGSFTLVTILDVEPGDDLVLDANAFLTGKQTIDMSSAGNFTVNYTAYTGAAGYTVYSPCGATSGTGTSRQITLQNGCVSPTLDLVVAAVNSSGTIIAFSEASGVAFTSGGSTTVTDTWHPLATVQSTYTNAPTKIANIQTDRFVPGLRGYRQPSTANTANGTANMSTISPVPSKALMQSILSPCAIGDPGCSDPGSQIITRVVDGTQTTVSMDVGALVLPWLGPPVYNPATTTIQVPITGSGSYDIFKADLTYVRNNTIIHVWHVFGPTVMNVKLPSLPNMRSPQPGDTMSATHARIGDSDAINGYRPARQNVFDALETCEQSQSPMAKVFPGTLNRFMRSN